MIENPRNSIRKKVVLLCMFKILKIATFLILSSSALYANKKHQDNLEQHRLVVMRLIGHEFLKQLSNDTSRVLPIEKLEGRYRIQFENSFEFEPTQLQSAVDGVMKKTNLATRYLVEVETCNENIVSYSYEFGAANSGNLKPCGGRIHPENCYMIYITLLQENMGNATEKAEVIPTQTLNKNKGNYSNVVWSTLGILILLGMVLLLRKKVQKTPDSSDIMKIGNTFFDQRSMSLSYKSHKIDLSGKETELLLLLFKSENTTLDREFILQKIWNDEGDYVGRTLDVFVSKLRKKLESDSTVRIINIRGIGYKLVVQTGL